MVVRFKLDERRTFKCSTFIGTRPRRSFSRALISYQMWMLHLLLKGCHTIGRTSRHTSPRFQYTAQDGPGSVYEWCLRFLSAGPRILPSCDEHLVLYVIPGRNCNFKMRSHTYRNQLVQLENFCSGSYRSGCVPYSLYKRKGRTKNAGSCGKSRRSVCCAVSHPNAKMKSSVQRLNQCSSASNQ